MENFGGTTGFIVTLAFVALLIAGQWKVNEKGGFPGWHAAVPVLNMYTLFKIAGRPGWWIVLMIIPFVNFVAWILAMFDLAKAFGRGTGFGMGLAFLSGIFLLILGFGSDRYTGAPTPRVAGAL